jgi:preprotein translocase subunit SecE
LALDLLFCLEYYIIENINRPPRAVFKNMSFTQKINSFFKEVWVEMKRVSWLARKDIVKYTLIVLGVTIVVSIFLGGLDYIFSTIIKIFILK